MSVSQILLPNGSPSQSVIAYGTATLAAGTATVAVAGLSATSVVVCTSDSVGVAGILRAIPAANQFVITSSVGGDAGAVSWIAIR